MLKAVEADRGKLTQLVQQALKHRPEVRPFPAAVAQLLSACQDANATPATFEKIIERDPALSVRLLRMANSPLYGLTNEVRGIGHATAVLGIRQLRHLALSVAGAGMFSQGATSAPERHMLWNHSLGCATVARLIARHKRGINPDDAFLGGIFHDVGKLFLFDVVPDEYVELTNSHRGAVLLAEEVNLFGISHEDIGLRSAHSWALAEDLKAAIGFHHRPQDAPLSVELVEVIAAANSLARYWGIGSEGHENADAAATALDQLALSEDQVVKLAEESVADFKQAAFAMAG